MAPTSNNDPVLTEDYILQRAFAIVEKKCKQSNILKNDVDKNLPRFQRAGSFFFFSHLNFLHSYRVLAVFLHHGELIFVLPILLPTTRNSIRIRSG